MLALAEGLTPEQVRSGYIQVYREMLAAGYTVVGEFHYLGLPEAHAAVEAAAEAGIEIVLLLAAYGRGGLERFRQGSPAEYLEQVEAVRTTGVRVGLAPHSVRACPRDWLEEVGAYAARESLPLHVHADEQPREIEECVAEHGLRPIELLAETGCLGPHTTVVHATHADAHELDLLAEAGARVCVCPTTEANLGDGFAPVEELCERGLGVCIGSGSNLRLHPPQELRELPGLARRPPRPRRPAQGPARAGGRGAPPHRPAWRRLRFEPALVRLRRGRRRARARELAGHRGRPGAPVARGDRDRRCPRRARLRLRRGRVLGLMVPEAPLRETKFGLAPDGDGWFVVNAREIRWRRWERLGVYCDFEGKKRFAQLGVNISVLEPGESLGRYHRENAQEDFLVVSGRCVVIVEDEERELGPWDLFHSPPGTAHMLVGAGGGPSVVVAVGTRGRRPKGLVYVVSEAAARHGVSVPKETNEPREAYADLDRPTRTRYEEGWLPDL